MMKLVNQLLILVMVLGKWSIASETSGAGISLSLKQKVENSIKSCEQTWKNTKELGSRFKLPKSPGFLASKEKKQQYKETKERILLFKKVYDVRFKEFTDFTNDKIKVRTAKTPTKMMEAVNAYSSNCAQFAGGIAGFVEWAMTGQLPKEHGAAYEHIYKTWIDEVKNQS